MGKNNNAYFSYEPTMAAFLLAGGASLAYEIISFAPPLPDSSVAYGDSGGQIVEKNKPKF